MRPGLFFGNTPLRALKDTWAARQALKSWEKRGPSSAENRHLRLGRPPPSEGPVSKRMATIAFLCCSGATPEELRELDWGASPMAAGMKRNGFKGSLSLEKSAFANGPVFTVLIPGERWCDNHRASALTI